MTAEALTRIDDVLRDWDRSPYAIARGMVPTVDALREARAEIVRLQALIPEAGTDENEWTPPKTQARPNMPKSWMRYTAG